MKRNKYFEEKAGEWLVAVLSRKYPGNREVGEPDHPPKNPEPGTQNLPLAPDPWPLTPDPCLNLLLMQI